MNIFLIFHGTHFVSTFFICWWVVFDTSISGYMSLERASAQGAAITEADRSDSAFTPKEMYAAITVPAMVANPPVITACNSDLVKSSMKGLISKGASVCASV